MAGEAEHYPITYVIGVPVCGVWVPHVGLENSNL